MAARGRDLTRRLEVVLAVVIAVGVWCAVLAIRAGGEDYAHARLRPVAFVDESADTATRDDLVLRTRRLAIPDGYLTAEACSFAERNWQFPHRTGAQSRALVARELGDDALVDGLLRGTRCGADGCVATPSLALVDAIPHDARVRLYTALGRYPENPQFFWPFRRSLTGGAIAAWPEIPDAARALIARTTWTSGSVQHFADLALACAQLPTDGERFALVQALNQHDTIDVELRTEPAAVERIVRSFAPRERPAVRYLLTSARRELAASTPLAPLLPAWVRVREGTYPARSEGDRNCFWSALHFRDGVVSPVLSAAEAEAELTRDYERVVRGPTRFGDVMAFHDGDGTLVHTAVALLGGLVFTKNGVVQTQPWRIDRAEEALTDYPETRSVVIWRRLDDR